MVRFDGGGEHHPGSVADQRSAIISALDLLILGRELSPPERQHRHSFQCKARQTGRPTDELIQLYALEFFRDFLAA